MSDVAGPSVMDGWENERDTERAKVSARWFAIGLLPFALLWIRRSDPNVQITSMMVLCFALAAVALTTLEALYLWLPRRTAIPRWLKYVTVFGDMVYISVLIHYTGNTQSPFFFVYFVFLISNCLRYGLMMSLYVALMFNILYVITLGVAPPNAVHSSVLGGEGLKIVAFWLVALYGGTISARLRRQANQLRVYEETIRELRSHLPGSAKTDVDAEKPS